MSSSNPGFFHDYVERMRARGSLILQPRMGFASRDRMREGLEAIERCPRPRIGTITVDSHTRVGNVAAARRALTEGAELNGYPIASYSPAENAELVDGLLGPDFPIQVRHGSARPEHIITAVLDAGLDATEGGPISYCLPYGRVPLRESIRCWTTACELLAAASERGTRAHLESFGGCMLGQLCPPALLVALSVLEGIFSWSLGITSISLSYAQGTHAGQDASALLALKQLARRYLPDVDVHVVFYTYMGRFAFTREGAQRLIEASARIAVNGQAERVIVKTAVEAVRIPSVEDNIEAIAWTRAAALEAANETLEPPQFVDEIVAEAEFLIETTLDADPSLGKAFEIAFRKGLLDIPYCIHQDNRNEVRGGIAPDGFVYWARLGKIPFPPGVVRVQGGGHVGSEELLKMLSFNQQKFDEATGDCR
jgi:methylaspartate mutase epsilon subunit